MISFEIKMQKLYYFFSVAACLILILSTNLSCKKNFRRDITLIYDSIPHTFELSELKKSISFSEIPRTVPYRGKKLLQYADNIINDSIVVLKAFAPYPITSENIKWNENPFKNDTWVLYYQNLFFVSILNHAYHQTENIRYHQKAKEYLVSYISNHPNRETSSSKFSWYDHACAFRVLHTIQTIHNELQLASPDINFLQKSFDHISENMAFMIDKENYSVHNHALMMDRSLLYMAKMLRSDSIVANRLKKIAADRALKSFDKIVDDSGLANEHSTTYHIFNHNLYGSIFSLIDDKDSNLSTRLKYMKMNDILLQLVKPDLSFPLWGDSQIEHLDSKLITRFGNDNRLRHLSKNYSLSSDVNFKNNIGVLRTNTSDKGYLAFFANYKSKVHKHHDDLSFVFQTLGVDILTDQGYYGYDKKYRPLLTSAFSHNTIRANNQDYILKPKGQYSKITGYIDKGDVEMIEAAHNMYDSIVLKRRLYFFHPNVIFVEDLSESKKNVASLEQFFNFGPDAKTISLNKNSASIVFPTKDISVSIKPSIQSFTITKEKTYRSTAPFKVDTINHLTIGVRNRSKISTLITINSPNFEKPINDVRVRGNQLHYSKDGQKMTFTLKR